jgi:hypothetical protein
MLKQILATFVLIVAGALKFRSHQSRAPALEDYLAFRCGPGDVAAVTSDAGHFLAAAAHCWGCYAMTAGAALLVVLASKSVRKSARLRAEQD